MTLESDNKCHCDIVFMTSPTYFTYSYLFLQVFLEVVFCPHAYMLAAYGKKYMFTESIYIFSNCLNACNLRIMSCPRSCYFIFKVLFLSRLWSVPSIETWYSLGLDYRWSALSPWGEALIWMYTERSDQVTKFVHYINSHAMFICRW